MQFAVKTVLMLGPIHYCSSSDMSKQSLSCAFNRFNNVTAYEQEPLRMSVNALEMC